MSDRDLLTLMQWLSPAFPVGGYAYSHGLEAAIVAGEVRSGAEVEGWLRDILRFGSGHLDACLLAQALHPAADHAALTDLARALAASAERAEETEAQGGAFTHATNALLEADHPPAPLPVAVGRAAAGLSLAPERVVAMYLHAFFSNLIQGAVRFVPLGQTEGQRILQALHGDIETVAYAAVAAPQNMHSSVFGADMAAMRHEGLEVRIFKT